MIVSIGLFSILVIVSIGVVLGVSRAQHKASRIQALQDNIRFTMELLTRELRTGNSYIANPTICASPPGEITFTSNHVDDTGSSLEKRAYFLRNGTIMRARLQGNDALAPSDCDGTTGKAQPLTSDEVFVNDLRFRVFGNAPGPGDGQAWITITLRTTTLNPDLSQDPVTNLQTTISQRLREL